MCVTTSYHQLANNMKVDLCLCLGTSLSGMNADRIVDSTCKRAYEGEENILGAVIINLQQTHLDSYSSIR
jgi:hypothetical protein